jgi:cob(I)alamin adenosyltransferase
MKKSKIYTKTGDKGTTSLIGGTRIAKTHIRLESYGTIDELNSFLGLLRAQEIDKNDKQKLLKIQNTLFLVGGALASDDKNYADKCLSANDVEWLEKQIDEMDEQLPPLKNFVIPSAYQPAAICHICRTISRKSERCIYKLSESDYVPETIKIYINRLSDYFFVLSRKISINNNKEEFFSQNSCM